jgi:flavin reductase (DIM6/NTAB) family NADH-FMN oxidoreductase RutF
MTIGWGTIGTNWALPVFEAYIRTSRYTAQMLDQNPEFTVNVPLTSFDRKIIGICGRFHGNEVDKIEKAGLTLVDSDKVSVPGIKELPLTLECKVIYRQVEELSLYPESIAKKFYPQDVDSSANGANRDPHIMVFGQIVGAYIIED